MCKTCLSGIHCPVQLHLATSMHLGKEEGRKGSGSTRLDLIFPIPWLSASCCLLSGKGMEGRSPKSFFSDPQCCCFSGSWPSALVHDMPKHCWANSIQQISLQELLVKPSPSDLCQCQSQQCGQQCPALLTTGNGPCRSLLSPAGSQ